MRKAAILLGLFAAAMIAVLVWGAARDREGAPPADGINCRAMPAVRKANGDVNEDALKRWKDKCFSGGRGAAANRFAHGTKLDPATIDIGEDERNWPVPRSGDGRSAQQAVLRLVSGSLAGIHGEPVNAANAPDDQRYEPQDQCLCRGTVRASQVRALCSSDWIGDNFSAVRGASDNASLTCPSGLDRTKLFFGPLGGTLTLSADGSARVSSK